MIGSRPIRARTSSATIASMPRGVIKIRRIASYSLKKAVTAWLRERSGVCSPIVVEAAVKATAHPPALLTAAALLNIPERASIVIVAAIGLLFSLGRASALGRGLVGRHEAWATATKTAHIAAGLTARRTTGSTTIAARRAAIASITPITSRRTAALMPAP